MLPGGAIDPNEHPADAAVRECQEETERIRETYQRRRDVLIQGLDRAGWHVEPPRGTMFVWAPVPEPWREGGSLEFSKLLLEKALVAVSPGMGFGPLGEGYVRFALVENDHRLKQATAGIRKFMRGA